MNSAGSLSEPVEETDLNPTFLNSCAFPHRHLLLGLDTSGLYFVSFSVYLHLSVLHFKYLFGDLYLKNKRCLFERVLPATGCGLLIY